MVERIVQGDQKVSVHLTQYIRTIPTQLMIRRWPSHDTFGMWTVLWTGSLGTQFDVSINVWRLAGDTLNITCDFPYCNHQVHIGILITLYTYCQTTLNRVNVQLIFLAHIYHSHRLTRLFFGEYLPENIKAFFNCHTLSSRNNPTPFFLYRFINNILATGCIELIIYNCDNISRRTWMFEWTYNQKWTSHEQPACKQGGWWKWDFDKPLPSYECLPHLRTAITALHYVGSPRALSLKKYIPRILLFYWDKSQK